MIDPEDRRFVESCLDAFYERCPRVAVGVPDAMRAGEPDDDGWCSWRMIESTVTDDEVRALEARIGCALPPVMRAYLTARHVLEVDSGQFHLPALPSDDALGEVARTLVLDEARAPGYLEIGSSADGDPVFLDLHQPSAEGDYPVVVMNHDLVPADAWGNRARLEPYAGVVAASFRAFFEALCTGREIDVRKGPAELAHEANLRPSRR